MIGTWKDMLHRAGTRNIEGVFWDCAHTHKHTTCNTVHADCSRAPPQDAWLGVRKNGLNDAASGMHETEWKHQPFRTNQLSPPPDTKPRTGSYRSHNVQHE